MLLGEFIPSSNVSPTPTKLLLHLNGNSNDSSGNGNNGTDTNITYSQANGKFGQGAGFNGSSSRIQVDDHTSLQLNGDFTISTWVKPTSLPTIDIFADIINKWDYNKGVFSGYVIRLYNENGTQKVQAEMNNLVISFSTSISTTSWTNISAIYNGSTFKMYINGSEVVSSNMSSNPVTNTKKLNIGNFGFYTATSSELGRWFNGAIDEVIIENLAWSAEKVKKYYTMTKGRFATL